MPTQVPPSVQALFWSAPHVPHTVENDAPEIIHKVLAYGDLEDIRWLKRTYDPDTLRRIFVDQPLAVYTPSALHFAATVVLHVEESVLDRNRYVKSVY
jgi:hypothetical protein